MGTHSMAKAYRILGLKTFHALDEPGRVDWMTLEKAAEASWPSVPHARRRPRFARADWDGLWGNDFDAVCDTAAPFTLELLDAYPDAKVVLVQRDFDDWWPSFQSEMVDRIFAPLFEYQIWFAWHLVGFRAGHAMRKLMCGLFDADTKDQVQARGRETYDRFYSDVRATVPPGQLLEFRMEDGWEPVCRFLGTDVPDVPFPFANNRQAHAATVEARQKSLYLAMSKKAALGALSLTTLAVAYWWLLL